MLSPIKYLNLTNSGDKQSTVKLDLGGRTFPDNPELDSIVLDNLLTFKDPTYARSRNKSDKDNERDWFVCTYGPVNELFETMPEDTQMGYAALIIRMRVMIDEVFGNVDGRLPDARGVVQLNCNLATVLYQFTEKYEFIPLLRSYVIKNIKIELKPDQGSRWQDTELKTFRMDDYIEVLTIALLCKCLGPILILYLSVADEMDLQAKNIQCAQILQYVLDDKFFNTMCKLENYARDPIRKTNARFFNTKLSNVYNGFTEYNTILMVLNVILIKRFVSFDFYRPRSDIVSFIFKTIKSQAANITSTGKKKSEKEMIGLITPPSERPGEDEGNISTLESESRISTTTADFPILIESTISEIDSFAYTYGLDYEVIDTARCYYLENPIRLNPLNSYPIGIAFGNYLCGARSVDLLSSKDLAYVVAVLQTFCATQGHPTLVHMLSAVPTLRAKSKQSSQDRILATTWKNNSMYIECNRAFDVEITGKCGFRWDTQLTKIISNITQLVHLYNTAPSIWEVLGEDVQNGQPMETDTDMSFELCSLIHDLYLVE